MREQASQADILKETNQQLTEQLEDRVQQLALLQEAASVVKDKDLAALQKRLDDLSTGHRDFLAHAELDAQTLPEAVTEVQALREQAEEAKIVNEVNDQLVKQLKEQEQRLENEPGRASGT